MDIANPVSVKCVGLDKIGYGPNAKLTRGEWQDQCVRALLSGRDGFDNWQSELRSLYQQGRVNQDSPPFEWLVAPASSPSDTKAFGWATDSRSHFVLDIPAHVFENHDLNFSGYYFEFGVLLQGSTFVDGALFSNCTFHKGAYFIGCRFESFGMFAESSFEELAIFNFSKFLGHVSFRGARFINGAMFESVLFGDAANFHDCLLKYLNADGSRFNGIADFSASIAHADTGVKPLGELLLRRVHFKDSALFCNREFTGGLKLTGATGGPTRFDVAPQFHNSKLHQDTTFADCVFTDLKNADRSAALAFNTLRNAMSQKQAIHEEQRFMRLELDAERLLAKGFSRFLYTVYRTVSGYGFSLARPFFALLVLPMLFASVWYAIAASDFDCFGAQAVQCVVHPGVMLQSLKLSLLQALPPLGLERASDSIRDSLFNTSIDYGISWFALPVVVVQKVLSLVGWFFIALALRNRFKMK